VEYTFNGSTTRLNAGNSKEYQVEAYTPQPRDISIISVPNEEVMKIKMETMLSGEEYIFTNAKKLDLEVENTLNYEITLMADNYIEISSSSPLDSKTRLKVPAQSKIKSGGTTSYYIYTDTPKFTIAPPSGYYPTIEWNITDNTMHVTIK
jgi:hypothetical protein